MILRILMLAAAVLFAAPAFAQDDEYEPRAEDDGKEAPERTPEKGTDGVGYSYEEESASGIRARREPYTRRCKDLRDDGAERERRFGNIEYAASHLGGRHTRRAWKDLVKMGVEGCDAVAAWLNDGGPGGEEADHADAAHELILYGRQRHLEAATIWLGDPSPVVTRQVARAVRMRLATLDEAGAQALVRAYRDDHSKIDTEILLGVLVGYYTTTYSYTTYTYSNGVSIPITHTVTVWHYAAGEPPPSHVAALRALIDGAGNRWANEVAATLRARCVYKGGVDQDPWSPVLLDLIRDRSRAEEVVDKAAHALGWMQPQGSDAIARELLDADEPLAQLAYLKGLRSRAKKGYGDKNTIWLLALFQEAQDPEVARASKRWSKAMAKKVRD